MYNVSEKELEKFVRYCDCVNNILCNGESAIGALNSELNVKISFYGGILADERHNLLVEIINKKTGKVDSMVFKFSDIIGKFKLSSGRECAYHLWKDNGKFTWYCAEPTNIQKEKIMKRVCAYIKLFK